MISARPNKWMATLWGLAGLLSAVDLFHALQSPNGNLTHPNNQILTAGSRVLLAVAFVIVYAPQRRPATIAVAVGALSLAIWGALVK
jgi:hypothetical protein